MSQKAGLKDFGVKILAKYFLIVKHFEIKVASQNHLLWRPCNDLKVCGGLGQWWWVASGQFSVLLWSKPFSLDLSFGLWIRIKVQVEKGLNKLKNNPT